MSATADLSRRTLLKVIGGAGASFVLGGFATTACAAGLSGAATSVDDKARVVFQPNAIIKVDPDGSVTVTIIRSDMGQGVRTSLAMLVAEEMDLDWSKVRVIQAPSDPKAYGGQGTGGSSSIRSMYKQMRQMGATSRAMLVAAAAKQWGVDPSECKTVDGKVVHSSGKSISYADLTAAASMETVPTDVKVKEPADFKILGKATSRVDNAAVATGKAIYGLDARTEGMAYAVIVRAPSIGAKMTNADQAAARKVSGVLDVVTFEDGLAVVASNTWSAIAGREALKAEWSNPNADLNSAAIREKLKAEIGEHPAMPAGAKVVEATFDLPFLAHATMEPMNALADVKGDHCTVWAPTQVPDSARGDVAKALGIPNENVTMNVTLLGGGFGRRLMTDFIVEAALVSRAAKRPVQVVWTREDDMQNDFYRPACHHSLKGAVDAGKPVAWSHQAVQAADGGKGKFGRSGLPYNIPNAGLSYGGVDTPIQSGYWRSVEHSQLSVVDECFIDELAHAAGADPFEFRRSLVSNERLRNVLELAAKEGDWGKPLPAGSGRGIACFAGYGSYIAHVVELSVKGNEVKLNRVVAAVDCGLAVNPKGVEAQVQGACVDGLSTALRAAITVDKGAIVETSWPGYRWMTMDAMPKIETHIVPSVANPGGMGEVGYPSMPAAVANAIFAATGKRARKFPIKIEDLV